MKIINRFQRIQNLDFLRGFVIILALHQHFVYYLNVWYVSYFKDFMALSTTYTDLSELVNKVTYTDSVTYWMAYIFTPWVSQIYLTLAAFNLSRLNKIEAEEKYFKKIKEFGLIFILFFFENMIVAPNTGEGISFYPIMLWMIVLMILLSVYRFFRIQGIIALGFVGIFRFFLPVEIFSSTFEIVMRNFVHPGFEYDARIEYFLFSGVLGFILGHIHYYKSWKNKDIAIMVLSLCPIVIYALWGVSFEVDRSDLFADEHLLAQSFLGTFYILGIEAFVISAFLLLQKINININFRPINWVGENSLLVFGAHRILFTKIILPIAILIGALVGWHYTNNVIEVYSAIFIVCLMCYGFKELKVLEILIKK